MSITKRMWEAGVSASPEHRAKATEERRAYLAAFFEALRPQHHAFIKSRMRRNRASVYRALFPHGFPSSSGFYGDVRRAGGLPAYLTHYFYSNARSCLEGLGLPPEQVRRLIEKCGDGRRYVLPIEEACEHAPTDDQIGEAETMALKPRQFRHALLPSMMTDRSTQEFFAGGRLQR